MAPKMGGLLLVRFDFEIHFWRDTLLGFLTNKKGNFISYKFKIWDSFRAYLESI